MDISVICSDSSGPVQYSLTSEIVCICTSSHFVTESVIKEEYVIFLLDEGYL